MTDFLFSKQLLRISNNLTTSDVTNLRFLCADLLPKRVLEDVKTGSDLFSALRGRNHISRDNLDFLEALLEAVHKVHLLQQLRNVLADPASAVEEEEDRSPSPPASSLSSLKFSTFLVSIGDELPQRDLKNVAYFFQNYNVTGLTAQEVQSIREPAKLFDILKQEKIISPTNVRKLWAVMDAIGRKDICEKIDEYARSVPGCVGEGGRGGRGGGQGDRVQGGRMGGGRRMPGAGGGGRIPEWELGGGRGTMPGWNDEGGREREREEVAVKKKLSQLPNMDPSSDDSMSDNSLYSFEGNRLMMNSPPSHSSQGPKTAYKDNPLSRTGIAVAEESGSSQSRAVMLVGVNKVTVQDGGRTEESMECAMQSVTHSGPREMAGHGLQRRTHTQSLQLQLNEKIQQLQLQLEHERAHHRILADQRQQNNGELARELERKSHEIDDLRKEIDLLQKQLLTGNDSEMYQMNEYPPHGKAIVIVNDQFTPNPTDSSINLLPRPGAEHDMFLFKSTFEFLGYEVECHRNLTCEEMNQVLQKAAGENHEAYDSFVCCISSHGDEKVIYGTDSVGALRSDLVQYVKSCKSLCGKPKMFFLQACRTKASSTVIGAGLTYLPDAAEQDADVFIANASTVNYASYRDHERGSWFVMALHHIFTRHGQHLTLAEMMYKVNNLVCTAQGIVQDDSHTSGAVVQHEARQCAETTSSFRMGLRFKFNTQ